MGRRKSISKDNLHEDYLLRELFAALLFTIGLFSTLSLVFYSSKTGFDIQGTMGNIGVFISEFLAKSFGFGSFIVPFVAFYTAVIIFSNKWGSNLIRKALSAFIFLLSTIILLGLIFNNKEFLGYANPGGWIGNSISNLLREHFAGSLGSYIIVTILLILSLTIASNKSLSELVNSIIYSFSLIYSLLARVLIIVKISLNNTYTTLNNRLFKRDQLQTTDSYIYKEKLSELFEETKENINGKSEPDWSTNEYSQNPEDDNLPDIVFEQYEDKINLTTSKKIKSYFHDFEFPPLDLLDHKNEPEIIVEKDVVYRKANLIEQKLNDLGVSGKVTQIKPGPVITMFEYKPAPGIKINKISSLENDLAMGLSALSIRIIAPIPGRDVIGIEVPNSTRDSVSLRELLEENEFSASNSFLSIALGKDISGMPFYMDLRKAPHLMIAGTTGSGKSVLLNTLIISMLYKATPNELKFIMIDPKMLELSVYEDIPHLLHPVVTEPKKAAAALKWAVEEMGNRYRTLSEKGVRDIESYNNSLKNLSPEIMKENWLPYIVIVLDELADLMMIAPSEIKEAITRLSQKARAAGIHLIVATQRPSADVVAGLIKANFPARISFLVSSKIDSRIILDTSGAECLLGKGDMLFLEPGTSKLIRIQGAFISDIEREKITSYLKSQGKPDYNEEITNDEDSQLNMDFEDDKDELYYQALRTIAETQQASISLLQRRLKIGYNRAARIVEIMEKEGLVGPPEVAGKSREVFIDLNQIKEI